MKKFLSFLFACMIIGYVNQTFAQEHTPTVIAIFQGDQASLDKAVTTNSVAFTIKNIHTDFKTNFENKAKAYLPIIALLPDNTKEKNAQKYTVVFQNNNPAMRMLNRLFIVTGIQLIEFNGSTISRDNFFAPYMK